MATRLAAGGRHACTDWRSVRRPRWRRMRSPRRRRIGSAGRSAAKSSQPFKPDANDGIDIAARPGEAVLAAADGLCIAANEDMKTYGKLVVLRHANGFVTVYADLSENQRQGGRQGSPRPDHRQIRPKRRRRLAQAPLRTAPRRRPSTPSPRWSRTSGPQTQPGFEVFQGDRRHSQPGVTPKAGRSTNTSSSRSGAR